MMANYNDKVREFDMILRNNECVKELRGTTILISGVTGTIGSYLFEFLEYYHSKFSADIKIVCPIRDISKISNEWRSLNNVTWCNYYELKLSCDNIDYVVHCASPTRSKEFIEHPVETIDGVLDGTKRMLELFRNCSGKGFLYISSIEVYGENFTRDSISETNSGNVDSLKIRNCYPIAKRLAENLCMAYSAEYKLPIKIARLSQIIGTHPSDDRLMAYICRSAVDKTQIVLHSNGASTKSYCYIMDCISAMIYILVIGNSTAYNVSNPLAVASVYELAKLVSEKYIGLPVIVENKTLDMYPSSGCLILNSEQLQKLGWVPEVGIEDAFDRLINQIKEQQ